MITEMDKSSLNRFDEKTIKRIPQETQPKA